MFEEFFGYLRKNIPHSFFFEDKRLLIEASDKDIYNESKNLNKKLLENVEYPVP